MAGKRGSLEVLLALGLANNKTGQHKEADDGTGISSN